MIRSGYNGWLVRECSIEGYEYTLNKTISDFALWEEMGRNSKNLSSKYEVEYNVDKLISIIARFNNVE